MHTTSAELWVPVEGRWPMADGAVHRHAVYVQNALGVSLASLATCWHQEQEGWLSSSSHWGLWGLRVPRERDRTQGVAEELKWELTARERVRGEWKECGDQKRNTSSGWIRAEEASRGRCASSTFPWLPFLLCPSSLPPSGTSLSLLHNFGFPLELQSNALFLFTHFK